MRWYKPVPLSPLKVHTVPDVPGVYVLLRDEADISSVMKIGPARSLRKMFEREVASPEKRPAARPAAMMYGETWADAREASRLIHEYRRKHGRAPALNSQF